MSLCCFDSNLQEISRFKIIDLADKEIIDRFFQKEEKTHNEFSFKTLYAWNNSVDYRYMICNDALFLYAKKHDFLFQPVGKVLSPLELHELAMCAKKNGMSGRFILVDKDYVEQHPELSKYFTLTLDRDNADYIYDSQSLAELSGRKFSKKRNLIAQFHTQYPTHEIRELRSEDAEACLKLTTQWHTDRVTDNDDFIKEEDAIKRSLAHLKELDLTGVTIWIENELVAFSLYGLQTSTMGVIQFEKFNPHIKGVGQVINQETAKIIYQNGIHLINREQDLGLEGLRQAKLSYYPAFLVETYKLDPK